MQEDVSQIIKNCYAMLQAYKLCDKYKDKQEIDVKTLLAVNFNDLPPYSEIKEEMMKFSKASPQEQRLQQSANIINKELDQIFKVGVRQQFFEMPLRLDQSVSYYQYIKYPMCFCWIRSRLQINIKYQQPLQEDFFVEENCILNRKASDSKIYLDFIDDMLEDNKTTQFYKQLGEKLHQAGLSPYNSYEDVFADCLMIGLNCMFYNYQSADWVQAGQQLVKDVLAHESQLSNQDLPSWCKTLNDLNKTIDLIKELNSKIQDEFEQ